MCLIVVQNPGDVSLSRKLMLQAWEENSDGAGYMFCTEDRLVVRKPFWRARDLRKAYRADHLEYGERSAFVLHWRIATHGGISEANTHPHIIGLEDKVAVVHNGVIPTVPPAGMSDTAWYLFCLSNNLHESEIMSINQLTEVEREVGRWNKMVFLSLESGLAILNEGSGEWEGERWFSNLFFRDTLDRHRPFSLQGYGTKGEFQDEDDPSGWEAAWSSMREREELELNEVHQSQQSTEDV